MYRHSVVEGARTGPLQNHVLSMALLPIQVPVVLVCTFLLVLLWLFPFLSAFASENAPVSRLAGTASVAEETIGNGIWRKDPGVSIAQQLDSVVVDNATKYAILSVLAVVPYTSTFAIAAFTKEGVKDAAAAVARGIVDALSLTEEQRWRAQHQISLLQAYGNWAGFLQSMAEITGMSTGEFATELGTIQSTMKDLADGMAAMQMDPGGVGASGYRAMISFADSAAADCGFETAGRIYREAQRDLQTFRTEMLRGLQDSFMRMNRREPPALQALLNTRDIPLPNDNPFIERIAHEFLIYRNEYRAADKLLAELPEKIDALKPAAQSYNKQKEEVKALLKQAAADLESCRLDRCRRALDQIRFNYFRFRILSSEERATRDGCWGWAVDTWSRIDRKYQNYAQSSRPSWRSREVEKLYLEGIEALRECQIDKALDALARMETLRLRFEHLPGGEGMQCSAADGSRQRERTLDREIRRFIEEDLCAEQTEEGQGGSSGTPMNNGQPRSRGEAPRPGSDTERSGQVRPVDRPGDRDRDGVSDAEDNCPMTYNPFQEDMDRDGKGDLCDDSDGDGILDARDNCPAVPNREQVDSDGNGIGDACQDSDFDGVSDANDNCPQNANPDQLDSDHNGIGDACEPVRQTGNMCASDNDCPIGYQCIDGRCRHNSTPGPQADGGRTPQPQDSGTGSVRSPVVQNRPEGQSTVQEALSLFGARERERDRAIRDRAGSSDRHAPRSGYTMRDLQRQMQRGRQQVGAISHGGQRPPGNPPQPPANHPRPPGAGRTSAHAPATGGTAVPASKPPRHRGTSPGNGAASSLYYLFQINARYREGKRPCRYESYQVMNLSPEDVDYYKQGLEQTVRTALGGRRIERISIRVKSSSPDKIVSPQGRGAWCFNP